MWRAIGFVMASILAFMRTIDILHEHILDIFLELYYCLLLRTSFIVIKYVSLWEMERADSLVREKIASTKYAAVRLPFTGPLLSSAGVELSEKNFTRPRLALYETMAYIQHNSQSNYREMRKHNVEINTFKRFIERRIIEILNV